MNTRSEVINGKAATLTDMALGVSAQPAQSVTSKIPGAAKVLLEMLDNLQQGAIQVTLPDGSQRHCGHGPIMADMVVHEWHVFSDILARGDIGAAESFIDGHWGTESLTPLLTLIAKNHKQLTQAIHGRGWRLASQWLLHRLRANTRRGSRRNIMAHYDLGNDFYKLWLDETMSYSSAWFAGHTHPDQAQWSDLPAAQRAKNQRMIRQLNLQPGDCLLEIGCGWGGFAEEAAGSANCHITGLTLSPAQLAFAQQRAQSGGWDHQASFQLTDYRDVQGQYDHIVSVEMFEAVGERWWPTYFKTLRKLLKPGGKAVVQVITINDAAFKKYKRGTDFIQRHVFPGGMLPSPGAFQQQATRAGLRIIDDHAFGLHYARTLGLWHEAFLERLIDVKAKGFDERFVRLWRFYLSYCEAGFRARSIDVHQYTLTTA